MSEFPSSTSGDSLRGRSDVLRDALQRHRSSMRLQDLDAALETLASKGRDAFSAAAETADDCAGVTAAPPVTNLEARRAQLSDAIRAAPSCARVGRLLLGRRHTLTSVHLEQALARMGQLVRQARRPPEDEEQEVFLGAREVLFSMLEQEGRQLSLGAACHLLCASTWMRLPLSREQQAAVEAAAAPALPGASATHAQELLSSYLRLGMRPGRALAAWVTPPVCAPASVSSRAAGPAPAASMGACLPACLPCSARCGAACALLPSAGAALPAAFRVSCADGARSPAPECSCLPCSQTTWRQLWQGPRRQRRRSGGRRCGSRPSS